MHVLHQGRAEYTLITPGNPPRVEKKVMSLYKLLPLTILKLEESFRSLVLTSMPERLSSFSSDRTSGRSLVFFLKMYLPPVCLIRVSDL